MARLGLLLLGAPFDDPTANEWGEPIATLKATSHTSQEQ
jgi:hypothetical protein